MAIKYKDIIEAKTLLDLPEQASMEEIKSKYRGLITRWHPDTCKEDEKECQEMTRKIISAYKTIITYCDKYQYSFSEEKVKKYLSIEDWWSAKFGNDPLWGNNKKS